MSWIRFSIFIHFLSTTMGVRFVFMGSPEFLLKDVGLSLGVRPRGSTHIQGCSGHTHQSRFTPPPPPACTSCYNSFVFVLELAFCLGKSLGRFLLLVGGTVLVWAVSPCLLLLWGAGLWGLLLRGWRALAVQLALVRLTMGCGC